MELQIYSPSEDGFVKEITWNHEQIKKEVAEKVSYYTDLVYTEDQIKDAKADRAKLRKFVDALEAKRKEIKNQCLAPYNAFEKQMKEIIAIVNQPIQMIDVQVKEYEEAQKEEKYRAIEAYWLTLSDDGKVPNGITLEKIYNAKWLNASVNIKTVCLEINARLEQIEKDLAVLAELPEFGFEATEVYKDTIDLNKAIAEGRRLSEMQKRKAEAEQLKAEQEATKIAIANVSEKVVEAVNTPKAPEKRWIGFQAYLSNEDALALRNFFQAHDIAYKKI